MPTHIDRADILQSWILQTAAISAFALSTFGMAYTLRRPAMRALSEIWALYVFTALAGTIASWLNTLPNPGVLAAFFVTLSPALVVSSFPASVAMISSIAERKESWIRLRFAPLWFGLGAFVIIGGVERLLPAFVNTAFWPRLFTTSMYAVSCGYAFRESRRVPAHASALRLLAGGFGLMGARVFTNLLVGIEALRISAGMSNSIVTMVQVFSVVLFGTFALLAVLDQERTAILTQAALLRDAETSVAASRRFASLGRLSAGIAHDFNNILSTILASASLARFSAKNAKSLDFELAAIEDAVSHATELTRQLQLLARNEATEPVVFDVNERLGGLALILERVLGRGSSLMIGSGGGRLETRMDPSRFDQVVLNLVVNARDAMQHGGVVRLDSSLEDFRVARKFGELTLPAGRYVRISVSDTGEGIAADVLPHIFEPFFTTKARGSGSGIGLATCLSVAVEAGGTMDVQSTAGLGSRFDVYLPAVTAV